MYKATERCWERVPGEGRRNQKKKKKTTVVRCRRNRGTIFARRTQFARDAARVPYLVAGESALDGYALLLIVVVRGFGPRALAFLFQAPASRRRLQR